MPKAKKKASFDASVNDNHAKPKFSLKTTDSREMKVYIDNRCVPADFDVEMFVNKYPQFKAYDRRTVGNAFYCLRREFNSVVGNRKDKATSKYNKSKLIQHYFYLILTLILL